MSGEGGEGEGGYHEAMDEDEEEGVLHCERCLACRCRNPCAVGIVEQTRRDGLATHGDAGKNAWARSV